LPKPPQSKQPHAAKHGGQLLAATKKFHIPLADWLDLSTGINPNGWPVPSIPPECWQRLPEDTDDQLTAATQDYYQCKSVLPLPGSQAGIQILPRLKSPCRVLVLANSYSEHAFHWQAAGHTVNCVTAAGYSEQIDKHDVVIVVNPDNPSGELISTETMLDWHGSLSKRDGWLLVDEAFIDINPENSLCQYSPLKGLLILRSLGKFFGLAGIRAGALIAEKNIIDQVAEALGPWSISHPTRWISTQALLDTQWHVEARIRLRQQSQQLRSHLQKLNANSLHGTELFQTASMPDATAMYEQFSRAGILTRLLNDQSGLRFGLPGSEINMQRLKSAISQITNNT